MKKEDGVSPVIAVMLILGLTVVLIGMAAAMFMGITSNATDNMDTSFLHPTNEWDIIKIVYDANGGTGTVPVDKGAPHNPGDVVTIAGIDEDNDEVNDLQCSGSYFAFWNTNPDDSGERYIAGQEINLEARMVLYAIWINPERYIVIYITDVGNIASSPIDYGSATIQIKIPGEERIGSIPRDKKLIGWSLQKDGDREIKYYPGDNFENMGYITALYAVWEDKPES